MVHVHVRLHDVIIAMSRCVRTRCRNTLTGRDDEVGTAARLDQVSGSVYVYFCNLIATLTA